MVISSESRSMAELRVEWEEREAAPGELRRPLRFGWGADMRTAVELLDRWPGEGHCYYRVRGDDGATYILRNDEREGSWRLVFFRRAD